MVKVEFLAPRGEPKVQQSEATPNPRWRPSASQLLRCASGAVFCALLLWMALSANPTDVRLARINRLIADKSLGTVPPALQKRLEIQFRWLAAHAGVTDPIAVNKAIREHQLTLVVTRPAFADLTHCGSGNAIFDPALNTIFIDEALIWPTETAVIGHPSVNSMFTINDTGYIVSYSNFILSHELGHWHAHNKAAAFFYYGMNDGSGSLDQETSADRFAVATILKASLGNRRPRALEGMNALQSVGVRSGSIGSDSLTGIDIVGGILQMSEDLLFASSPYSPYYADGSHPSLLSRVNDAVDQVSASARVPPSELRLVEAQIVRYRALGSWPHRELYLSGALSVADVRAGSLWLGRTDIPDQTPDAPVPQEAIYRLSLRSLVIGSNASPIALPGPVRSGHSKVGKEYDYAENPETWVSDVFETGDSSIGLPRAALSDEPQTEREFGASEWGGLAYVGMAWTWPAKGKISAGRISEGDMVAAIEPLIGGATPVLGKLQWQNGRLFIPVVLAGSEPAFVVFELETANGRWRFVEQTSLRMHVPGGEIEAKAATAWHGSWWVPVRMNVGQSAESVDLWIVRPNQHRRFARAPLLIGQATALQRASGLPHLTPRDPKFMAISGGRALFGYDGDSLYVVDEREGLWPVFHPAKAGLRVLDLGAGRILFWMLHARKTYLIDTSRKDR